MSGALLVGGGNLSHVGNGTRPLLGTSPELGSMHVITTKCQKTVVTVPFKIIPTVRSLMMKGFGGPG